MNHHNATRRLFLRHSAQLAALTGPAAPLALNLMAAGSVLAQTAND